MTIGQTYILPSGRRAECIGVNDHQANFRYLDARSWRNKEDEVSLSRANWQYVKAA